MMYCAMVCGSASHRALVAASSHAVKARRSSEENFIAHFACYELYTVCVQHTPCRAKQQGNEYRPGAMNVGGRQCWLLRCLVVIRVVGGLKHRNFWNFTVDFVSSVVDEGVDGHY